MSAPRLKFLVDSLSRNAVRIAEQQPHRAILIAPPKTVQDLTAASQGRGELSAALHAYVATLRPRPREACFIFEAWMVRADAPEWARDAGIAQGVVTLEERYRREILLLTAEDDEGNWYQAVYGIEARRRGGVRLLQADSGTAADDARIGGMPRFVPRRGTPNGGRHHYE